MQDSQPPLARSWHSTPEVVVVTAGLEVSSVVVAFVCVSGVVELVSGVVRSSWRFWSLKLAAGPRNLERIIDGEMTNRYVNYTNPRRMETRKMFILSSPTGSSGEVAVTGVAGVEVVGVAGVGVVGVAGVAAVEAAASPPRSYLPTQ